MINALITLLIAMILGVGYFTAGVYAETFAFLATAQTVLFWAMIGFAAIALLFVVISIVKAIRR